MDICLCTSHDRKDRRNYVRIHSCFSTQIVQLVTCNNWLRGRNRSRKHKDTALRKIPAHVCLLSTVLLSLFVGSPVSHHLSVPPLSLPVALSLTYTHNHMRLSKIRDDSQLMQYVLFCPMTSLSLCPFFFSLSSCQSSFYSVCVQQIQISALQLWCDEQ